MTSTEARGIAQRLNTEAYYIGQIVLNDDGSEQDYSELNTLRVFIIDAAQVARRIADRLHEKEPA